MKKTVNSGQVGDVKSPALQATESGLRVGRDQASQISANQSSYATKPSTIENCITALKTSSQQAGTPTSCKQFLWLSFFFDGTGNNRELDLELSKHSNIARLYHAHKPKSQIAGILSVYIQGVGTRFPEIGDEGGSSAGLGCGAMGEERLGFALKQFDEFLALPLARAKAPVNGIREINIAVFGFSRGAALARAFVNLLMDSRCKLHKGKWALQSGGWPVRFRFLGLFDTVASVGTPMSLNTTGAYQAYSEDAAGMIGYRLRNYRSTRPERLAFSERGIPGADPAPGLADGHNDWGGRLKVHETVEEVRHFIAAHEIRNSFPVDSLSVLSSGAISKPSHFYETVYPGAHSDVGGGYASGEGGKSLLSTESLSLVPLIHMYNCALRSGVPMSVDWTPNNKADFNIDPGLCDLYNHYAKTVGSFPLLGEGINRHMSLYYAWRFRSIKSKSAGDNADTKIIRSQELKFRKQEEVIAKEILGLEAKEGLAKVSLNALLEVQAMNASGSEGNVAQKSFSVTNSQIEKARNDYRLAREARLQAKARKDSVPSMKEFEAKLNLYDAQLLQDVKAIRAAINSSSTNAKRGNLRPHYKVLLEAYENEFENNKGLNDERIISFFDNYVHDSLSGFAKDATLPSDPRVVYLGEDEKYQYASLRTRDSLFADDMVGAA